MSEPLKVLIVEDAPADAELAATVLTRMWPQLDWHRVDTAAGLRRELDWQPDIIIADYEVPGFGAVAALGILHELGTDTPLIVFTGAVTEEIVVRCMRLGAADYLLKDRLTRLGPAVENALRLREERRAKQRTEREQQRLAELNSAILNSLPAYIALLDTDGRIAAINEAWRLFGTASSLCDAGWGIGTHYVQACSEAAMRGATEGGEAAEGMLAVLEGRQQNFLLEYACHSLLEKRWFRMTVTPVVRGQRGAATGGAVVMHLNITDRKLAEEQLKINANALRHLTEGVVITDANLRVVTVNKAFSAITGYLPHETLGLPLSELVARNYPGSLIEHIRTSVIGSGSWRGEIQSRRKDETHFPAAFSFSAVRGETGTVEYFTAVFTDLSSVREVERRIEYLSQHDALTGLQNRAALAEHLRTFIAHRDAQGGSPALFIIELDRFKTVNDTLGHRGGDALLRAVADRLMTLRQGSDVLARLGGDEFVLLAPALRDATAAERVAEKLRATLEQPFEIDGQQLFISASIGVSCYPTDGEDFELLLRAADTAVYRAKQLGRNTVAFFSAEMNAVAREHFLLRNSLAQALARRELVLEYQPTVDLRSGQVTGVEALLRWNHPELGRVAPSRFIGLAEDTGLIIPISEWVLREACRQLRIWVDAGWPQASVAVNLSARQFAQPDLASRITETLSAFDLPPHRLRLEITESMLMNDPLAAASTLATLNTAGIQIALDDFGTGYSSLSYLKRFRAGCLKVDRSFVSGIPGDKDDESIVHAVVALGKALAMKVVAEGVESEAQAEFLHAAGCDDAQGYYYSRPLPVEQVLPAIETLGRRHLVSGSGRLESLRLPAKVRP